jgi:hypothetical protein
VLDSQLAVLPQGTFKVKTSGKIVGSFFGFMSSARARKKIIKNHYFIPRSEIGIFILIAKLFKTTVDSNLFSVALVTSPIDNFFCK